MDDLDRWTRVLPLGAGAFGQVHLAWDTTALEWVAVKRFTGQDELGLLRFVIESRIRVAHPHLVRTLAFRLVDDRAWLVTQLARGGSVRQVMQRSGPLPWGWVAEAVDQVLDALVALHATGVVHRDLKPANLLLRDGGAVRPHLLVGDFGIATWRTVSMTGIGAAIGTPGYLAPEYLDGQQPAPATDLFAVGVLAAELLAGRRLVHYSNASPDIPADWNHTLPLPSGVPAAFAAVLRRMAEPDPRHRYVDCAQAREALLAAAPPSVRGDLASVVLPDLLASVPPGWTANGPEEQTTALPTPSRAAPAAGPSNGPAAELSADSVANQPHNPAAQPPTNPAAQPPADPAADRSNNPAAQSPTNQPNDPAAQSPAGSAANRSNSPAAESPTQAVTGPPTPPPTPAVVDSSPTVAVRRSAVDARAERDAAPTPRRARRRGRRAVLLVVLLVLAAGAGTLWWAATHRDVAGQAAPAGAPDRPEGVSRWTPVPLEPCTRAELGRERAGGDERCQRTEGADAGENWVRAPSTGFPKSDPAGPFPAEPCTAAGDTAYTPVGDQVVCTTGAWRVTI